MRKALSTAVAVASVLVLTACGSSDPNYVPPSPQPTQVIPQVQQPTNQLDSRWDQIIVTKVPVDGTEVTCIVYKGYKQGGLSCDWAHPGALNDSQQPSS